MAIDRRHTHTVGGKKKSLQIPKVQSEYVNHNGQTKRTKEQNITRPNTTDYVLLSKTGTLADSPEDYPLTILRERYISSYNGGIYDVWTTIYLPLLSRYPEVK
jgi:hypothetical protein